MTHRCPDNYDTDLEQLFPHIKHVMSKYSSLLAKDELKKFAKEVGKKLVASDFKNKRVDDPTKISEKQEKKVKKFVKDYFDRAVEKKKAIDRKKAEKAKAKAAAKASSADQDRKVNGDMGLTNGAQPESIVEVDSDVEMDVSDDEDKDVPASVHSRPTTPADMPDLKRKREDEDVATPGTESDVKRMKEEDSPASSVSTPPPPPPPPPTDGMAESEMVDSEYVEMQQVKEETEEDRELRRQEAELMKENEEAMMMEDEIPKATEQKLPNFPPLNGHSHGKGDGMEGIEETVKHVEVLSH